MLVPPWLITAICAALAQEVYARLSKAPQPDDVIPFTVTLHLNTLGQRLAFVVLDDAGTGVGRGELDYNYKPRKRQTSQQAP